MATSSPPPTPAARSEWRVILPLCLTVFAVLVHGSAIGPLAKEMARDLDTPVPLIGQVSTLIFAMMAVAGIILGPLADHFGRRAVILLGLGTLSASAAVMGLAPTYPVLLLGGLIAGVGASTLGLASAVAAARYAGDTRRRMLGRIQASQTSGSILGAPILTAVAAAFLWRGAYVIVLLGYLLATVLVVRGLERDPRSEGRFTVRTVLAAYRPLVRDRRMLALYGATALRALGWLGPFVYLGAFYADERGLSLRQIGVAYMLASGGMFVGNLAAGQWLGGTDLRRAFAVTTGIMALAWGAIFTLPLTAPQTVAAAMIASFAAGMSWISLTTLLAAETPAGPGTTMTLNGSVFALGSALGTAVGGVLVGVGGYHLLGIGLPACTLVAGLLVWRPQFRFAVAIGRG
jgi:predicted MFS family arabinose efflux permease